MDIDQTQDCCFTHEENWFRYRVGAIILEENSVLVATNDACDFCYSIGGGVHLDESAEEAVRREVLEETGLPYEIDRLAFVHENFFEGGRKYRRAALPRAFLLFSDEAHGQAGDHGEERASWLPVDRLSDYTVYPLFYAEWLPHLPQETVHIVTDRRRK